MKYSNDQAFDEIMNRGKIINFRNLECIRTSVKFQSEHAVQDA